MFFPTKFFLLQDSAKFFFGLRFTSYALDWLSYFYHILLVNPHSVFFIESFKLDNKFSNWSILSYLILMFFAIYINDDLLQKYKSYSNKILIMKIFVEFSDTMRICDQRPKINASILSLNSFFINERGLHSISLHLMLREMWNGM